jgi:hypothetical protein
MIRAIQRYGFVAALAAGLMSTQAHGQAPRLLEASLGGGPTLPIGNLDDESKIGTHVTLTLGYQPSILPFRLRGDIFYQNFNAVQREPSIYSVLGGEWYKQIGLALNGKYSKDVGNLKPYLLAGAGYNFNWHSDRTYNPERQRVLNFNAGLGVDVRPLGHDMFIEVRGLSLFGGEALDTRLPTIHRQVDFKSIPVTVGVRF